MTLADLLRVAELLPADASLTLTKALLLGLLAGAQAPSADLTVRDVAERLHRAPSTVAREVGHNSTDMIDRVYGHLGTVRHRGKQVEYRVAQHRKALGARLRET